MKKTLAITLAIAAPIIGLIGWAIFSSADGIPGEAWAFLVVMFLSLALPIAALVDAARVPGDRWREEGLDKTTWIVIIIVGGIVGGIAYFGWIRRRLPAPA